MQPCPLLDQLIPTTKLMVTNMFFNEQIWELNFQINRLICFVTSKYIFGEDYLRTSTQLLLHKAFPNQYLSLKI